MNYEQEVRGKRAEIFIRNEEAIEAAKAERIARNQEALPALLAEIPLALGRLRDKGFPDAREIKLPFGRKRHGWLVASGGGGDDGSYWSLTLLSDGTFKDGRMFPVPAHKLWDQALALKGVRALGR